MRRTIIYADNRGYTYVMLFNNIIETVGYLNQVAYGRERLSSNQLPNHITVNAYSMDDGNPEPLICSLTIIPHWTTQA